MPPKKRKLTNRASSDKARKRACRQSETEEERAERLEQSRSNMAAIRSSESTEQRSERQERNREHMASIRSSESNEQRSERQERDREYTSSIRSSESNEQRSERQVRNRENMAETRALESVSDTQVRLAQMRLRYRIVRSCPELKDIGLSYHPHSEYDIKKLKIGSMNIECPHCHALKFQAESPGLCCSNGKVVVDPLLDPPPFLRNLLTEHTSSDSQHFLANILRYNSAFAMTSFGADKNLTNFGFTSTYQIQGQCYHLMGSLLPPHNGHEKYLQVYFINNHQLQSDQRLRNSNNSLLPHILHNLQSMLHEHHSYVQRFKHLFELMPNLDDDQRIVILPEKRPANHHPRRYNTQSDQDAGIVLVDHSGSHRDIVLYRRSGELHRISETNRAYDPIEYPLMFWDGSDGYTFNIPMNNATTSKTISCKAFYAYMFFQRQTNNSLFYYRDLFNRFAVDMYAKTESERLTYIRTNQSSLRSENYAHLRDALASDTSPNEIGKKVILPSSFIGSPRYMHERTQDAMSYVRKFGRPDLFITFTCNPKWPEITSNLYPSQQPHHRHDIIARVFHQKQKHLIWLLNSANIFGELKCYMTTLEWQKRGLPHSHTLVWCANKLRSEHIDKVVSAEIPSKDEDPILHETVSKHMIHGPCGLLNPSAPCMKNGKCTKNFPKPFSVDTSTSEDGYPIYRRRSQDFGGECYPQTIRGHSTVIDNRWVVPHNKFLCKLFNAHINVEVCNSIKAIIYVTKYINKGCDMASITVNEHDEVKKYLSGRYISSNEAFWRIFGFDIHQRNPTVTTLAVHLENGQRVYFDQSNAAEKSLSPPATTLTAFFTLCQHDEFAKSLLYSEVPQYYTWSKKAWHRRKMGERLDNEDSIIHRCDAIGRVYTVHPSNRECFFLRLLLHHVRGPTSFASLRTVDGAECPSFYDACKLLGLLQDECHWENCLVEAVDTSTSAVVRNLFSIIISVCEVKDTVALWLKFRDDMSRDYAFRRQHDLPHTSSSNPSLNPTDVDYNSCLLQIMDILSSVGRTLEQCGLPTPSVPVCSLIERELSYDRNALANEVTTLKGSLTPEQLFVYDSIIDSCTISNGRLFFIDAPGGTGKTYVNNLILSKVRSMGHIALAVSSSGIASTLLQGGRTAHSTFRIPLEQTSDTPSCNISKNSPLGNLLRSTKLIIWDEATMANRYCFEALDNTLRDICSTVKPMGGITFVMTGDFRQTLPVVPNGTRADEVRASIKSSKLWSGVHTLKLSKNMRVSSESRDYADFILNVGNGTIQGNSDGLISLPYIKHVTTVCDLIQSVYPSLNSNSDSLSWLNERAILCPRNDAVDEINSAVSINLHTYSKTYASYDTVVNEDLITQYPTEFLNSLNPTGFPPHSLALKVGMPVMLLRNLNPPKLCNGSRLQVKNLLNNTIECVIMTGRFAGETCLLPRIPLNSSQLPFEFRRLQFPVKPCFAMTINKSQGQTIKCVGIDLRHPVFSHGQLYVALSRSTSSQHVVYLSDNSCAKNIVYTEVL